MIWLERRIRTSAERDEQGKKTSAHVGISGYLEHVSRHDCSSLPSFAVPIPIDIQSDLS